MLKKFVSVFNKKTGKIQFLTFHGGSCKEGKISSSLTRMLQIWTITEKIELAGWVQSKKKRSCNLKYR